MSKDKRDFLKEKRKKLGLTQEKAAELLEISNTYYNQIENGERNPSLDLALKISDLFVVEVRRLKG